MTMLLLYMIRKWFSWKKKQPVIQRRIFNPVLKTVKPGWEGTPLDEDGKFINEEYPTVFNYGDVLKFFFQRNPQWEVKKRDTWRIPVLKDESWLQSPEDMIVWFGHASFYIQLSGIRILIDPVFGKPPVVRRYSEMPVAPGKLLNIDYILVSHAHYDHCDKPSLKLLAANNPRATILCGLKLDHLIGRWVSNPVEAAGWYQQFQMKEPGLSVTFLPSRHWANRSITDVNTTLWGGFMIQYGDKCIYYGGDSGHGSHFRDIGEVFSHIDVALIGAGAYSPAWFMGQHHQDPYNAVEAFHATGAKTFIPFHYGTFDSADEPMGEPEEILKRLYAEGKIRNNLKILKLGEAWPV